MEPIVIITAIGGLIAALTAWFTSKGTNTVGAKTSHRDDFTVIVEKFKEIIEYRETQIEQQKIQIDILISENKTMRIKMTKLIDNYEEMKAILSEMSPTVETAAKIDKIYKEIMTH